jgi:hypothetical protein
VADSLFESFAGRSGGLFDGNAEPRLGAGFGVGGNPLLGMIAEMLSGKVAQATGLLPGQFFPTQNLADQLQAREYNQDKQRAMMAASQVDRTLYTQMFRTTAERFGQPFGAEQLRAANTLSGDIAAGVGMFGAMAPELVDALHGSRGSAAIMAMSLMRGGRTMVDPITGLTGLRGTSASNMTRSVYDRLYGDGADITAMRGISAGQTGMLIESLQSRGLLGASIGSMDTAAQHRAIASADNLAALSRSDPTAFAALSQRVQRHTGQEFAGLSQDEKARRMSLASGAVSQSLDEMKKLDDPAMDTILRSFDANKITERVKSLSGAVAAMRDIFGDSGRPNAPMRELIEGLNHMTQGGLTNLSANRLEQTVRTTSALTKLTGMSLDNIAGIGVGAAEYAQQLGMSRLFGPDVAMGAAAFGHAVGASGGPASPNFFAADRDKLTLMDAKLRVQAAGSEQANVMGAVTRLVTRMQDQNIDIGGAAQAYSEAVKAHQTTFVDPSTGKSRSVFMSREEGVQILQDSGIDRTTAMGYMRDRTANQETIHEHSLQDLERQAQSGEITKFMGATFAGTISQKIRDRPGGREASRRVGDAIAMAFSGQGDDGLSVSDFHDTKKRNAKVMEILRRELSASGINLSNTELAAMAENVSGHGEHAIKRSRAYSGFGSMVAAFDANRPDTIAAGDRTRAEAHANGVIRSAMAGIGQAGPLRRIMDLVAGGTSGSSAIGSILNLTNPETVRDRLATIDPATAGAAGNTQILGGMVAEMIDIGDEFAGAAAIKDPKERQRKMAELSATSSAIATGNNAIAQAESLLTANGFAAGDLDDIISGKIDAPDELRRRVTVLKKSAEAGGLAGAGKAADVSVGAKVGAKNTGEALSHARSLKDLIKKGGPKEEIDRHAKSMADRIGSTLNLMGGDAESIAAMGKGGAQKHATAVDLWEQAQSLARKRGVSVDQLLASTDNEAAGLRSRITGAMREIQDAQKANAPVTDDDRKNAQEYIDQTTKSDPENNKKIVDDLLKAVGAEDLGEDERKSLESKIHQGRTGSIDRHDLRAATSGLTGLDRLSARHNIDPATLRKAAAEGKLGTLLSGQDLATANAYAKRAGKFLSLGDTDQGFEGNSASAVGEAMDGELKPGTPPKVPGAAAPATAITKLDITGTLDIPGIGTGTLVASTGVGSTP